MNPHRDHMARKTLHSLNHHGLLRIGIPKSNVMNLPAAKAMVDNGM